MILRLVLVRLQPGSCSTTDSIGFIVKPVKVASQNQIRSCEKARFTRRACAAGPSHLPATLSCVMYFSLMFSFRVEVEFILGREYTRKEGTDIQFTSFFLCFLHLISILFFFQMAMNFTKISVAKS